MIQLFKVYSKIWTRYSIMDKVFNLMDTLLNYGYSIQIYRYTTQSWIEYSNL